MKYAWEFVKNTLVGGLLIVVAGRYETSDDVAETTWAFTSLDGVTWSGPVAIGAGAG